jgi:hypothetical protein
MGRDGHKWRIFKDLEVIRDGPFQVIVADFVWKGLTDMITGKELLQH